MIREGGMGQVYEAYESTLQRRVALKVSRGVAEAPSVLAEARALAAMHDPSVPAVFASGACTRVRASP